MSREELLSRIKQTILELEPGASIFLFGSRARGTAGPESDWDLLIIVDGILTMERKDNIRERLFLLELQVDEVLSPIIYSRDEWSQPRRKATPLYKNVMRERVPL